MIEVIFHRLRDNSKNTVGCSDQLQFLWVLSGVLGSMNLHLGSVTESRCKLMLAKSLESVHKIGSFTVAVLGYGMV